MPIVFFVSFLLIHKSAYQKKNSKLQPRGDGPFQVLEIINDNAYKIDLPGEYNVSATFNVADLTLFDTDFDSRSNHFEERGDDVDQPRNTSKDPVHFSNGPMTRSKTKTLKDALNPTTTWKQHGGYLFLLFLGLRGCMEGYK